MQKMCQSWEETKHLHQAVFVGFFGKPNAGKSSLINNLLGSQRLIVSQKAGTTRDYIEVPLKLKSGLCTLVDTAGVGEAIDEIDTLAMQKSQELLDRVDFKILVVDGTESIFAITYKTRFNCVYKERFVSFYSIMLIQFQCLILI